MNSLSKKQLQVLGSLSNQAYQACVAAGTTGGLSYDEWRHQSTADQCGGQDSWRLLEQRHFIPLCNFFLKVIGKPPMKDRTPKTPEESMIETLKDRMRQWEAPMPYVARIVANKTGKQYTPGASLEELLAGLDARTVWQLVITIERACRRRVARRSAELGIPAPVEVHASRSTMPPPRLAAWRGDVRTEPPSTRTRMPRRSRRKRAAT